MQPQLGHCEAAKASLRTTDVYRALSVKGLTTFRNSPITLCPSWRLTSKSEGA